MKTESHLKAELGQGRPGQKQTVSLAILLACMVGLATQFASPLFNDCIHWDINIYHTIGREMLDGAVPYRDLVDHKGPLLHFLFALAAVFNPTQDSLAGLMVVLIGFYALAFHYVEKLARIFVGGWWPQIVMCVFALVIVETQFQAQAIDFIYPLHVASFYYLAVSLVRNTPPSSGVWILWGVCFSCAFFIKIPYAMAWGFAPVYWCALAFRGMGNWPRVARDGLALFAGVMLPVLAFVLYFSAMGALKDFWYWYFEFNMLYPESDMRTIFSQQILLLYFQMPEYLLALLGVLLVPRYFNAPVSKALYVASFVFCFAGMALPGRNTYVQCMAPYIALGIIGLVAPFADKVLIQKRQALAICVVLAVCTIWNSGYLPRRWDGLAPNPIRDRCIRFIGASKLEKAAVDLHLREIEGTLFAPLDPVYYRLSGAKIADKFFFPPSVSADKFPETWEHFARIIGEGRADWVVLPDNYESLDWAKRVGENYELAYATADKSQLMFRKKR